MARPSARKKIKNPSAKVSRRVANRHFKRKPSLASAPKIIRDNWDKNLTLIQNYERIGLIGNLNDVSGGINSNQTAAMSIEEEEEFKKEEYVKRMTEKVKDSLESADPELALVDNVDYNSLHIGARIGQKRIKKRASGPTEIVKILEAQVAAAAAIPKPERHISSNEELICKDLIAKHGDDYQAMFRDLKLNKYQLTAKQLKKKCEKYLKSLEQQE